MEPATWRRLAYKRLMRLLEDTTRFKDLAAGFQSVALILAVLIGGVWTAGTFYFEVKDRNLQRTREAELKSLRERENLKLTMAVTPLSVKGAARLVDIRLDAQNSGNYPIELDFTCDPVRVWQVDMGPDGRLAYRHILRLRPLTHASTPTSRPQRTKYSASTLRAGGLQSYHFVTPLPKAGLYWIAFSATETVEGQPACPNKSAQPQPDSEAPARTVSRTPAKKTGARWSSGVLYAAP